jgi:hypothetical protein
MRPSWLDVSISAKLTKHPCSLLRQLMEQVLHLRGIFCCHCMNAFCFILCCDSHLTSLFTSGAMVGFDASGHIAEETKHAR